MSIHDPYKIQVGDDNQEPAGRTYEESFQERQARLDAKLSKIERQRVVSSDLKPAPLSPGADAGRQDQTDEEWIQDMQTLASGSYTERQELYEARGDRKLSPEQAKRKNLQDRQDDAWVENMVSKSRGGQR